MESLHKEDSKIELNNAVLNDAEKAREWLEAVLWPDGPVCPHCGNIKRIYEIKGNGARPGLRMCSACRKQFTVTIGTIFENSPVPLNKWIVAWALFEQNLSILKISKIIETTYKTTWYMVLRIKHEMGLLKNNELPKHKVRIALYNLTAQGKVRRTRDGKYYSCK